MITGGTGMVGHAFEEMQKGDENDFILVGSKDCDLTNKEETLELFSKHRPNQVIHLAAKVGGVSGNTRHVAEFYSDNIQINTNVLLSSYKFKVKKVVSMLSTCIYPDDAAYPLTEEQIHDGPPHHSNYGYAYAKRMLDVQSRAYRQQHGCNFITAVPNNLFGEYDNFHLEDSHVIPAIIRKMYESKLRNEDVVLWGDGTSLREFTYSKDLAEILIYLLNNYDGEDPINIGNTVETSIKDVAELISMSIGYGGDIVWDKTRPKGQHRKPSNNSKLINLGWDKSRYTDLSTAIKKTCDWFVEKYPMVKGI